MLSGLAISLVGCVGERLTYKGTPYTISHFAQPVTLTTETSSTQLGQYTVRLISIADDGTTQIQVVQTEKTLIAQPGEYFQSFEFGREGRQLTSASKATGTATFMLRRARHY